MLGLFRNIYTTLGGYTIRINLIKLIDAKVNIEVYPSMDEKPNEEDSAVYDVIFLPKAYVYAVV